MPGASNNNTGVMAVLDISEHLSSCAEHQGNAALQAFNTCLYRGLYWDRKKYIYISLDHIFGNTNAAEIEAETCFKPWNTSQWCRGRKQTVFFLYIVFHVSNEVTHKICIIQAAWINDGPQRFRSFWAQLESRATFLDRRNETILIINLSCLSFSSTPTPSYPHQHPTIPPDPTLAGSAEKCDEALASALPHTAFTSSSVFSNGYAPGYAKLNRRGGESHRKASWLRIDPEPPPKPKSTFRDGSVGRLRKMWTVRLQKVLLWVVGATPCFTHQRERC